MTVIRFPPAPELRVRLSDSVRYLPLADWIRYSGLDRPTTHLAIQAGKIRAKQIGPRTLLIDLQSGDAFLDQLPDVPSLPAA